METDLNLTKKAQKQISSNIIALMCYSGMVHAFIEENKTDKAFQSMKFYNDHANELIAMGIEVNLYNLEGVDL
jgi:hypothetical protein